MRYRIAVTIGVLLATLLAGEAAGPPPPTPRDPSTAPAPRLRWEVVGSSPHDPTAFLQGLVWHDGGFFESTGLEGQSTLRRLEWPSGRVVKQAKLPPDVFGEGL